ncbi:hypothetical protein HPB50_001761 [Hyalomma asiaticum]|uniref:Uncharacterized protein n=1 Tax=Hyalomma asiaticum TaxID=266040 RepID=A0ACB7T7D1_HYAAI|nr:hypothetical protein HPB50_001761 [Hyalomma asiaticum]
MPHLAARTHCRRGTPHLSIAGRASGKLGGLQRNGTLRSSTIKKVAPPVVPDNSGSAATGRRHSSSSACTTPVHQLHSPPTLYGSEQPPPSPTTAAYDGADQKFSPGEVFSEAQLEGVSGLEMRKRRAAAERQSSRCCSRKLPDD